MVLAIVQGLLEFQERNAEDAALGRRTDHLRGQLVQRTRGIPPRRVSRRTLIAKDVELT